MSGVYFTIGKDHEGIDVVRWRYPEGEEPRLTEEQAKIAATLEIARALNGIDYQLRNLYDQFGDIAGNLSDLEKIADSIREAN